MALPKRRHSTARGRRRRTHWKIALGSLSVCPQCKNPKPPHVVCPVCGTYKGKQIREIKVKKSKEKKA